MISLETSLKVGKSPKKLPIAMSEEEESGSDTGSENVHSMDGEANMESADEGMDNTSGDEGDHSNTEEESEESPSANSITDKTKANPNWADAMRKVLHTKKPKRKKTIVLSKAKKLCDIIAKEKKEPLPFEIEGTDGEIKKEISVKKETKEEKEDTGHKKRRRKEIRTGIRIKPSILDRERERTLQKIATKGVVQLFNAVRQQQMEIEKKLAEAGPVERKREKVLKDIDKRAFLDVLMGGTKSISVDDSTTKIKTKNEKEEPEEGKKVWKVLREDFVMGASLKDWDKKTPEEDDSSAPEEIESDE